MVAGTIGFQRLARLIDAAVKQYMPDQAEADRQKAAEQRRFDLDLTASTDGLASVSGVLDVAAAFDLEAAVSDGAARLGRDGCDQSLDVRRSLAAGDLTRGPDTLDYTDTDAEQRQRRPRGQQVVLSTQSARGPFDTPADAGR